MPKAKGGKHLGFKKLAEQLAEKGARSPKRLARYIEEKKFGKAAFKARQKAGMKKAVRALKKK